MQQNYFPTIPFYRITSSIIHVGLDNENLFVQYYCNKIKQIELKWKKKKNLEKLRVTFYKLSPM